MSQPWRKSILNIRGKDWCWSWNCNALATWSKKPTHWKRFWWWERLRAGERGNRGWDGWVVSPTQWAWVWANSGRWWQTRRSGVLQSTGSQTVSQRWKTEQQQTPSCVNWSFIFFPLENAQLSAYISIGVFAFVFLMINKKIFMKINFCHLRGKQNSFQFVFDTLTLFMAF